MSVTYTIVPPGGRADMLPHEQKLAAALRKGVVLVSAQLEDGAYVEITRAANDHLVVRTERK